MQNVVIEMEGIVARLKDCLGLGRDADLARTLEVKPQKLSVWKVCNTVPYEILTSFCIQNDINLEWILTGQDKGGHESHEDVNGAANTLDDDPNIGSLLEQARNVLKSGNPVAYDALERNIRYFSHAIEVERRLQAMEERLKRIEERAGEGSQKDATSAATDADTGRKAM